MKKNIIIALLAIVSVVSLIYGHHQKQLADNHKELADLNAAQAQQAIARTEEALKEANMQREIALHHMALAEQLRRNSLVKAVSPRRDIFDLRQVFI